MALFTAHTLILTYSLTLLTVSWLLLFSPHALLSSSPIWLLGESMHIRPFTSSSSLQMTSPLLAQGSDPPSDALALAALVLTLTSLTQIVFAGGLASTGSTTATRRSSRALAQRSTAQAQWMILAGVRVLLTGLLTGWIYVFGSERRHRWSSETLLGAAPVAGGGKPNGLQLLANNVVFTGSLSDMLFWGYVWTVLREEARELAEDMMMAREEER